MERLTKFKKALIPLEIPGANKGSGKFLTGLTLLELLISITLITVVILTSSAMLIGFKKFYFDFMQRQSEIGEVSLGILEEIANRIMVANSVTVVNPSKIEIRVDNTDPAIYTDDTVHTYWKAGSAIKYKAGGGPTSDVAQHVGLLQFELQPTADPAYNRIKIKIGVIPSGGTQQDFETTIVARASSA